MLNKVEKLIQRQTGLNNVYLSGSGTDGFFQILKYLSLNHNDEILIPDFICEILAIPLLSIGIKFKLVDIEKDKLLPNLNNYKNKYNSHTKVILLAYLWGYVHEDLYEIIQWAKSKKLIIIEDIASAYGLEYNGKKLGTFGDYTFGSFGKGKMISFGQYGFYTIPSEVKFIKRNFSFFSKEILNYIAIIKKIRRIKNSLLKKYLFLLLAKIHPFYLGYNFHYKKLKSLYQKLLKFSEISNQRKKNTSFIFKNIKSTSQIMVYPINNDQKITTRVCCVSKKEDILLTLQNNNCWVGSDFRHPISKLLNIDTPTNIKSLSNRVFNILTEPNNKTLNKTIKIINNGETYNEIS